MSQNSSSNQRRRMREVAQDSRMRELVVLRTELEAQYHRIDAWERTAPMLKRGMKAGLLTAINIVKDRMEQHGAGTDQPKGRGEDRPDAGTGG